MSERDGLVGGPFPWASSVDYSQAAVAGGLVILSGQYAADDHGDVVTDDFAEQARLTFTNIQRVLAPLSLELKSIIQLRCLILRPEDYPIYRAIRREFLQPPFPTSTLICVPAFAFPRMLIEIEAVARFQDAEAKAE